ncbi:hypothetical protein BH09ACT7_BH09ACT7_27990 [soil metagenome]
MALGQVLGRIVGFLRAGQPAGVPSTGYSPALSLLRRRLSEGEISYLATQLARHGVSTLSVTDISVAITRMLDDLPSQLDIQRMSSRLVADGWTIRYRPV